MAKAGVVHRSFQVLTVRVCEICKCPCDQACSTCLKASYCSKEHQKDDWERHKSDCFPVTVLQRYDEDLGRYLVAARDISPGELIFEEKLLVTGPASYFGDEEVKTPNIRPVCLACCAVLKGSFRDWKIGCSLCSWPVCDDDCEKMGEHEFECDLFHDLKLTPARLFEKRIDFQFEMVTIIRMLLLKERDPMEWKRLLALESKEEPPLEVDDEILESSATVKFILNVCSMRNYCLVDSDRSPPQLIYLLAGILKNNKTGYVVDCFSRTDVYQLSSKLTHSCVSNTFSVDYPVFPDTFKRKVRANIKIEKGTILTEFYNFHPLNFFGVNEKRRAIYHYYHFWCKCPRCIDPTELASYSSAIRCKNSTDGIKCPGFYLPVISNANGVYDLWQCNNMICKSNAKYYDELFLIYSQLKMDIANATTLGEKIKLLKTSKEIVHENHALLMGVRNEVALEIYDTFIVTRTINISNRRDLSITMREVCNALLLMADRFCAEKSLERGKLLYLYMKSLEMESELVTDKAIKTGIMLVRWEIMKEAKEILAVLPHGSPELKYYQEMWMKEPVLESIIKGFWSVKI